MTFGLINLILLLAAAQGILLSILLIHKHRKLFANYFLASLIALLSITLLYLLFSELGWYKEYPVLMLIPVGLPLIANPLFYFYAKYLIRLSPSFRHKDWLHFIPFVLYEIYLIPDYLSSKAEIIALFDTFSQNTMHIKFLIFNWLIIIQGVFYLILILVLIKKHSRSLQNVFSNIEKLRLNWLRNIIIISAIVWSVFILENIFYLFEIQFYKMFDIASLFAALLVYTLGYLGFLKSEMFEHPEIKATLQLANPANGISPISTAASEKKYEKSGLNQQKAQKYLNQLQTLMEEKQPYLDSNLTLNQLADMLSISPHNLSEVINTQLNLNFFDYINQFRVKKVKQDLSDPDKFNLTLLAIGLEAGFNSKSSFNAIFKKHTGKTPSEFRKSFIQV